jgi:histidinol-phosphate aminotransferase
VSIDELIRPQVRALPAYVPGARPAAGARLWKLSSNENPYPPLPSVERALVAAASQVNRYPDMYATELAEAYAQYVGVDADQVVVGTGSVAMLSHVLQAFVRPGEQVVYGWRSFEAYPIAIAVTGGVGVPVPLDDDAKHDLPAMLAAITDVTRVVLVCTPNNPTGPAVHDGELRAFLAAVPPHVVVVVDEAYLEFVRDGEAPDALALLAEFANVVVLRTMSKAFGLAGLRVGFALAAAPLAAAIRAVATPFGVNSLAQVAALASLEPAALAELNERVEALVAERDRVTAALAAQGYELPETQANFVWFPLGERTMACANSAAHPVSVSDDGLLVRPFEGEGIRVTIGEKPANDRLLEIADSWQKNESESR